MLVMQRSCSRNSIDGKRNDRSLVLVGTEYDVDFDLGSFELCCFRTPFFACNQC
jgi:hypothetical protein